ncbi:MAG: flavodoxin FldB [Colwellia sp.]|nr:flavodoxin FldB [Colwellia sp.]
MNIGLFYGSTTCYTEMVAEKIQQAFTANSQFNVVLHNIKDDPLSLCQTYDFLIFGISTWDYGELQEDWESNWTEVSQLDLSAKVVTLYGMGDQVGYSEWFQDALGMLHEQLLPTEAYITGYWPNVGYEFTNSKALTADQQNFVGLSLDDESQYQLTDERIEQWVKQLNDEFKEILTT